MVSDTTLIDTLSGSIPDHDDSIHRNRFPVHHRPSLIRIPHCQKVRTACISDYYRTLTLQAKKVTEHNTHRHFRYTTELETVPGLLFHHLLPNFGPSHQGLTLAPVSIRELHVVFKKLVPKNRSGERDA